ncbi:hypothetical protein VOLCADRAFT_34727, partial [Volvox carteri f. nagariensis]
LAPCLTVLFNRIYGAEYPREFTTSTLSPIFKKGGESCCDNYRGIAVGGPLCKLYANIIGRRLNNYCEGNRLRAVSQAGCR